MNIENNRFVLSDGSIVNSKGYKIDINGINLTRFKTNPIMFYEHNSEKVIGRWKDVQKEPQKLTALPEFDTNDPEALSIAGKVERGFLNAASIGIIVHEIVTINNTDVVTHSELLEASIVTVPSDAGAVRLYNENLECLSIDKLNLSLNKTKNNTGLGFNKTDYKDAYKQVCDALGLNPQADINEVLETIGKLMNPKAESEIKEALRLGLITDTESKLYLSLMKDRESDMLDLLTSKKRDFKEKRASQFLNLYNENSDKIITYLGLDGWKEIQEAGFSLVQKIVNKLPERIFLSKMIVDNKLSQTKDLDWYRKHNPKALRDNPELYQSLLTNYKQTNNN